MSKRTPRRSSIAFVVVALVVTAGQVWGLGFILGQTKEELKLQYDVSVYDHKTGRVTVTITITDDGRLNPIESIDLHFPSADKHVGGGNMSDLSLSLATRQDGGKRTARVHLRKEWAQKAELWLTTSTMDGKYDPMSRQHFIVPVGKYMEGEPQPKKD
jgi:hypothetical protein